MGIRGELFSSRVGCNGRTYFFNVKENRMGDMYLTVVESKPTETEGFERRSIVVFREDMADFVKAFQDALGFMGAADPDAAALSLPAGPRVADRKPRTPGGFAGSETAGGEAAGAGKRRIVVRKKGPSAKGGD